MSKSFASSILLLYVWPCCTELQRVASCCMYQ